MKKSLLYYKPHVLLESASPDRPGTIAFSTYTKLYAAGSIPCDRNGIIKTPFRTESLFPIPTMQRMTRTLEEVCNERARELLNRAVTHDTRIYVLWSGGIDSTLVLVSLLKMASADEKKRITVLLSKESILENPRFYEQFVRGSLTVDTPSVLPSILGTANLLVNGEHNDQLFGSDIMVPLIQKHGTDIIHAPYRRDILEGHFKNILQNDRLAARYVDLFERLPSKSPVPIVSNFDFVWWVNFSLKWNTVYGRTLTYTPKGHEHLITADYAKNFYAPFYNTETFQLWSLNNQDKRIKDTWVTYKWPCKEIIFDFTKDAEYRDTKLKHGSLGAFVVGRDSFTDIDTSYELHETFDAEAYYDPENDFVGFDTPSN